MRDMEGCTCWSDDEERYVKAEERCSKAFEKLYLLTPISVEHCWLTGTAMLGDVLNTRL